MSKNVSISEGGVAKTFLNVAKIKTNLTDSGTQNWIPEDEAGSYTLMPIKYITQNGVYTATDDGYQGYRQVNVNVSDAVTGKDPDDGQTYTYTVDENGNIIKTPVTSEYPFAIKVTKTPDNMTYNPGDTINYSGIIVKAYNADGTVWTNESYPDGVIPYIELVFPTGTA